MGVLHYMKPSGCVSPACWGLMSCNSPPFCDGVAAVRGGAAPKVQTTSVKNAENGLLWAKWSAFWAQQCLAWLVGRNA